MNMPKKYFFQIVVLLSIALSWSSCSEDMRQGLRPVPTAYGRLNQLVVVADQELWESNVGDTITWYYAAAYPILPQPEPIYDLVHFTPYDLEAQLMRRELRTYLIVADLSDEESPTAQMIRQDLGTEKLRRSKEDETYNVTIGRDKWAKNQLVVYQFGWSREKLIDNIKANFPAVYKRIEQREQERIDATIFFQGDNPEIQDEVRSKMDANIKIPSDYFMALNDDQVIWVRKETDDLSSNLLIYKVAYNDEKQLSKEGIKAIRDSLGRKYISSTLPNTYMRINDVDLPMLTEVKTVHNQYALEARGIWEIENDFMGGAFLSYLIHNPDKKDLLFVDGFVHAPGKDKRDFMEQLEYILSTTEY